MMDTTAGEGRPAGSGLTGRAALIMTANVIALGMTFLLPLVLVRTLSQTDFGLYKQAFQIVLTALGLLNLQVAASVFYFMAREPAKRLAVVHNMMLFYGLAGAVVFIAFLVWPRVIGLIVQDASLVGYVPLVGLVIWLWLVATNLETIPIAAGDVRAASLLIVGSQFTRALVMIVAAVAFGSVASLLVAGVLQAVAQIALMLLYLRQRFGRLAVAVDWPLFRAQIGSSLPFGVGGLAAVVQNDLHYYFVAHHFDAATFAVYSVGCFQLPLLGMLTGSFASVLNPELARFKEAGNHRAIIRVWMDVARKLAFVIVPACAAMFVFRAEIITTLFTASYAESIPVFGVNVFAALLGITVYPHMARIFDQLRYLRLKLHLVLIPLTLGALHVGLWTAGLTGVAAATVLARVLAVGIILLVVGRRLGLSRRDMLHLGPLARIGAAAVVAGVAAYGIRWLLLPWSGLGFLAIGGAGFGAVYLLAVLWVGAVTREERRWVRDSLQQYARRGAARLGLSGRS
jgi:O-antigen/teichoic acid export membrane protein